MSIRAGSSEPSPTRVSAAAIAVDVVHRRRLHRSRFEHAFDSRAGRRQSPAPPGRACGKRSRGVEELLHRLTTDRGGRLGDDAAQLLEAERGQRARTTCRQHRPDAWLEQRCAQARPRVGTPRAGADRSGKDARDTVPARSPRGRLRAAGPPSGTRSCQTPSSTSVTRDSRGRGSCPAARERRPGRAARRSSLHRVGSSATSCATRRRVRRAADSRTSGHPRWAPAAR